MLLSLGLNSGPVMKAHRGSLQILLLAGVIVSAAAPADARSRACDRMAASLLALSHARARPALAARYDNAIAAQIEQLRSANATIRRSGCTGLLSIFGSSPDRRCRSLQETIAHMKRNLSTLRERHEILSGRGSPEAEKRRIARILKARGCNTMAARATTVAARPSQIGKPASAFDQTLGNGIVIHRSTPSNGDSKQGGKPAADDAPQLPAIPAGTYSTLCVRTCDGFYFPLSYATTPENFARDERICEARCPGADAHLYYHRVKGQEAEDMVSLTGVPYRDLPTAFLYRRTDISQPRDCGCGTSASFPSSETPVSVPGATGGESDRQPNILTFGENRPSAPVPAAATPKPAAPMTPRADRKVRVVGPRFFPDPSTAIDLRAPDRKEGP
jgi:hypothetical protein